MLGYVSRGDVNEYVFRYFRTFMAFSCLQLSMSGSLGSCLFAAIVGQTLRGWKSYTKVLSCVDVLARHLCLCQQKSESAQEGICGDLVPAHCQVEGANAEAS